jgi:hypothetical protein
VGDAFLRDGCDFMSERWIGDLELEQVRVLDGGGIGAGTREYCGGYRVCVWSGVPRDDAGFR